MIRIEQKESHYAVERDGASIGAVFNSHGNQLGEFNAVLHIDIGNISVEVTAHGNTPAEAVKKAIDLGYYGAGSIDDEFGVLKAHEVVE